MGWFYFPHRFLVKLVAIFIILLLLLFLGFKLGARVQENFFTPTQATESNVGLPWRLVGFRQIDWKIVLSQVLPLAAAKADYVEDESQGLILSVMKNVSATDLTNPELYFQSQIAHFNEVTTDKGRVPPAEPKSEIKPDIVEKEKDLAEQDGIQPVLRSLKDPLVGIYCTHNAECYVPTQGVEKLEGKNGGVFSVAERLKNTLEMEYGIPAILVDKIHDYPEWSKSYANSLATLEKMKKEYPSIRVFIDVHRDAKTPRHTTTAEIDGQKVSKIMFVVGSNKRLPHPHWKKNQAFAQKIALQMEKMFPGLLKGVRVQDGRYNQHISTQAILLEMGGTENSLAEAEKAAEMFAAVLNSVL